MTQPLSIALTKGRILKQTLPLTEGTRLLLVRASDVPAYVEYGGADIGVTGKDVLLEHSGRGLYAKKLKDDSSGQSGVSFDRTGILRVATKYPEVTRRYFDRHGQQVEIIKLYGSMELAPLVGLADLIVDIMETGATLIAKASMKMKHQKIHQLIDGISQAV